MYKAMSSWRDLNPDWAYHFYSDLDCEQFIADHFEQDVLDAYQQLIPGAYRADLWRYCVLYIHGGFYADAKMQLHLPLTDLLPKDTQCLLIRDHYRKNRQAHDAYIYQAIMAFCPQHAVLKSTIEQIVAYVKDGYYGYDALDITGPSLLGKMINCSLGRLPNEPLNQTLYLHPAGSYTVLPNQRRGYKTGIDLFQHNAVTMYASYYQERTASADNSRYRLDKDYAACWFRREVFRHGRVATELPSLFYRKRYRRFWVKHIRQLYHSNELSQARAAIKKAHVTGALTFRLLAAIAYEECRQLTRQCGLSGNKKKC
jgi:hypothetical protein